MTLPANNTPWPPPEQAGLWQVYEEHAAWYSADPERLAAFYAAKSGTPDERGRFWAQQIADEIVTMLHLPVAGDIAQQSAALLFGESPKFKIAEAHEDGAPADAKLCEDRLAQIVAEGGVRNRLLEAAETCSAMGGVFIRPVWDADVADYPILSVVQADNAIPTFSHGILSGCIMHTRVETDATTVWRLVEDHRPGGWDAALYRGSESNLGVRMPLTTHPATAGMAESITTSIPGLLVRYIPNKRPYRRNRGLYIGRSDIDGLEGLLDSIDEVYTSLIRDVQMGLGRIIGDDTMFESNGTGGFSFNLRKPAYMAVNAISGTGGLSDQLILNQFAIRVNEHVGAVNHMLAQAYSLAGYSPATFGLHTGGMTGVESGIARRLREQKSFSTTASKASYWKPAVEDVLEMMLVIDREKLGNRTSVYRPVVEMQDGIRTDFTEVSGSVEQISRAACASLETLVGYLHPDWEAEQIAEEVQRVQGQQSMTLPDVTMVGRGDEQINASTE